MEFPKKIANYSIFGNLGSGGYGQVFVGRDQNTLQTFAIKVSTDSKSLSKEYSILKTLSKNENFLKIVEYGKQEKLDYIVMEMLGKNFVYKPGDNIFSLKTVASIGVEILNRFEIMHEQGIVHRDIKPSQFLLSHDRLRVYLVDYGLATYYKENNIHSKLSSKGRIKGSLMYASINTHLKIKQSRRDDLESLLYSLIYLLKGELPWVVSPSYERSLKWKIILNQKIAKKEILFQNIPNEFEAFYQYIRKMTYEQTPNYRYLKGLLEKFIPDFPVHLNFDWVVNPSLFSKVESYVEIKGKNCVLYFKNVNGDFFSRRRNGNANVKKIRKGGKSVTVKVIKNRTDSSSNIDKSLKTFEVPRPELGFDQLGDPSLGGWEDCDNNKGKRIKILSLQPVLRFSENRFSVKGDGDITKRELPPGFGDRFKVLSGRSDFMSQFSRDKCLVY